MDVSACNALNYNSTGVEEFAIIYDVACQFGKSFEDRVESYDNLVLPQFQRLLYGVGKFHLGAHILDCFYKFSLNFLRGIGQGDGEILETLWSEFNKLALTTRSMSFFHRSEVIDDFMRHSNFKKAVAISMFSISFW